MFYYTYITRLIDSDRYYVGRHQSKKHPEYDKYYGSGKWVRSIKDKSKLYKKVIAFYDNEILLLDAERLLIHEHIHATNCMNMNENPVGFSSKNNPSKSVERKLINKNRMLLNNPMTGKTHSEETKQRIRIHSLKQVHTEERRKKQSNSMKGKNLGKVWTEEQKLKLSELRKEEYRSGSRIHNRGMKGKKLSEESIQKMKDVANKRPRIQCEHCQKEMTKQNYKKWHGDKCKSPCHS